MSSILFTYLMALVVVGLMLGGLYAIVKGLQRGRILTSADRRLVTVLESTMLSQHAAIHVVKAGTKYLIIGGSNGQVNALGEMPSEEVEAWLAEQRTAFGTQRLSMIQVFKSLRGKP